MKTLNLIFTLALTLLLSGVIYSQNITGTLGTDGVFKIKDASNDYLTLNQSTGQVNILRTLRLENTTSSTVGVIYNGADRFIHNYGINNIFMGINSGNFTMTGQNNSAFGYQSLLSNTLGYENSAFGWSLSSNTTGSWNSAYGTWSLYSNTTGNANSAYGERSLRFNTTGSLNSALGNFSLSSNTTGSQNTAIGYYAGGDITTGSNNIAIGYNAQVPTNTASNQIRLGNTNITYAGIQVAWTVTSDRRYKDNIAPVGMGLGFISKLNPVSYVRKNDENKKTEYGLIAQEVEQVLKELGIENHAMLTITDEGMYELRYNDLIAPMIKAIQELKEENQQLRNEIKSVKSLYDEVEKLKQIVNTLNSKSSEVKLTSSGKEEK